MVDNAYHTASIYGILMYDSIDEKILPSVKYSLGIICSSSSHDDIYEFFENVYSKIKTETC